MKFDKWTTAIHEAAHAIVAEVLNVPVCSIRLIKDCEQTATEGYEIWNGETSFGSIENPCIAPIPEISVAGHVSYMILTGNDNADVKDSGSIPDYQSALGPDMLTLVSSQRDPSSFARNALRNDETKVRNILITRWDKVEALANKLIKQPAKDNNEIAWYPNGEDYLKKVDDAAFEKRVDAYMKELAEMGFHLTREEVIRCLQIKALDQFVKLLRG